MENKNLTAVEWLQYLYENRPESTIVEQDFEQAKQMEKQQIEEAWEDGKGSFSTRNPEQYYNETYGGGGREGGVME